MDFIVTVHGGEFTITGETLTYDSRKRLLSSEEESDNHTNG